MDECEFKNFCDSIGYAQPCENDEKDIAYCMVRITLNSPQFKKQSEEKIRKAIDDFREELVEAVKFFEKDFEIIEHIIHIIRTHGKEE